MLDLDQLVRCDVDPEGKRMNGLLNHIALDLPAVQHLLAETFLRAVAERLQPLQPVCESIRFSRNPFVPLPYHGLFGVLD